MTTVFVDIDGTLVYQGNKIPYDRNTKLLPGVLEELYKWTKNDYTIILTTGRKECEREKTIKQLDEHGIIYDRLIMGIRSGKRVLINDIAKIGDSNKAYAINILRNQGLKKVNVEFIINQGKR